LFPEGVEGFFTTGLSVGRRLVWHDDHLRRLATHAAHFGVRFDHESLETELETRFPRDEGTLRCRIEYSFVTGRWGVVFRPWQPTKIPLKCRVVTVSKPLGCWKTFPRPDFALAADEEVILVDAFSGVVYEGSYTNVFVICENVIFTPPSDGAILPGICREKFLRLLRSRGTSVREEPFGVDLVEKGELLLTNALRGVMKGVLVR